MNEASKNTPRFKTLLIVALLFAAVKLLWSIIGIFYLPATGVDADQTRHYPPLFYRYRLASDALLPPPPVRHPDKAQDAIKGMKLLAIYRSPKREIVVVQKGSRSYLLSPGEALLGYRLKEVQDTSALFEKGGNEYRLELPPPPDIPTLKPSSDTGKTPSGARLKASIKDSGKIWKNIGISPEKERNRFTGLCLKSVKRGELFGKRGVGERNPIAAVDRKTDPNIHCGYETVSIS